MEKQGAKRGNELRFPFSSPQRKWLTRYYIRCYDGTDSEKKYQLQKPFWHKNSYIVCSLHVFLTDFLWEFTK